MDYKIIKMSRDHWEQVRDIYYQGIRTGIATFQTDAPSLEQWDNSHLKICRFVACHDDVVLGWIALSPTSSRTVYKGVVEVSIYIGKEYRGMGIGKALMKKLIKESEDNGIWSLYSAIIKENIVSIRLHEACGFRKIGVREKIAKLSNGKWSDTVLMELRSKVIGNEDDK